MKKNRLFLKQLFVPKMLLFDFLQQYINFYTYTYRTNKIPKNVHFSFLVGILGRNGKWKMSKEKVNLKKNLTLTWTYKV